MIIKKSKDAMQHYFEDNSGITGAFADFVCLAQNEDDICSFLADMSRSKIPVTVAGALTGNTGSGLAFGGAILSLEQMNQIGDIEVADGKEAFVKVQAGARISDIKDKVKKEGWMYAPDPTEYTAFIGGNISTNASGARGFKFGATRKHVCALEVVFSDGSKSFIERGKHIANNKGIIKFNSDKGEKFIELPKYVLPKNIKNAAGYYNYPNADLIDVLIGSDGTLCVIESAILNLIPHFKEVFGAVVFFENLDKCYDFVKKIKINAAKTKQENLKSSINPMSVEFFDKNALSLVETIYPDIPKNSNAAVMFEQDIYGDDDETLLNEIWIAFIEKEVVDLEKIWFAENLDQMEKFRTFRHKIPECVNEIIKKNKVPKIGTDFAVPEGKLANIMDFLRAEFEKIGIFNLVFGHIGENHLHANILAQTQTEYEKCKSMYIEIAKKVVELGGTVSAEHGIGKSRHIFLEKMLGENGFIEMAKLKKALDPANILGRSNIFPEKYLLY
ncbi:MAG: FAD-binding oxidoreductase [Elusimicrobiota bacterium]|jgi:D-lactate dehydrogenase (cytochrome)|nr:FAD-binding oxidoreductase [Elusimicrobiota bacterium]